MLMTRSVPDAKWSQRGTQHVRSRATAWDPIAKLYPESKGEIERKRERERE